LHVFCIEQFILKLLNHLPSSEIPGYAGISSIILVYACLHVMSILEQMLDSVDAEPDLVLSAPFGFKLGARAGETDSQDSRMTQNTELVSLLVRIMSVVRVAYLDLWVRCCNSVPAAQVVASCLQGTSVAAD